MEQTYGYIRVSSTDQNEIRQRIALEQQAIPSNRIFMDKMSGKDFQRPQYQAMLKEKNADIVVLDMPLLDTRRDKNLLGTFIADLVLQVLSFVAQNERENIRSRQAQGIAAAKQSGVRFGHAPRPLPPNFPETYTLWTEGAISTSEAAKRSGMARSTFRIRAESFKKNCP